MLTAGALDVSGGGAGVLGRARYDAGGTATVSMGTDHLRGPMFTNSSSINLPISLRTAKPEISVVGKPLSAFKLFFIKPDGSASSLTEVLFGSDGTAKVTLSQELDPGANQICLVTKSGDGTSETRNCADIAYLY